jgi:hypothetical protein
MLGVVAFAAAVAYVVFVRPPAPTAEPTNGDGGWSPAPGTGSVASSEPAASEFPPPVGRELKDFHTPLDHTQCEDGMKHVNALRGLPATDQAGLRQLSVCLRIGNLAWYKCVLAADGEPAVKVCNRRFLSLDNPP